MDPNIVAAITGIAGVLTGAGVLYIALRKMPSEIGKSDSETVRNISETNKILSAQLNEQGKKLAELQSWFTGTLEIVTKLDLSNPPKVLAATVKRIPITPDRG